MENLMATKADKKRWDDLHVALEQADIAFDEFDSALRVKYGSSYQSSWLTAGQEKKLNALRERKHKLDDKILELLRAISPRGERWMSGAPTWWLTRKLTWEDAIRPADEPLSVVVPGSYGNRDGTVTERHAPARVRSTRATENRKMARKKKIDFDDQDAVLDEVAKALDIDPDELSIDTSSMDGFGVGDVYEISIDGGSNTWGVVENEDVFRELALAIVKQDLEEDPSMFERSFIEQHINIDRLRRDLESDVQNTAEEDLREMSDRDFWRTAKDYIDIPDEDDDGDMPDPEDYIEDVAEKMTKERLRDPMEYLEEMYSSSEAVEKAIEIAGIDVNAAAEDAVDTDGPEHFVARYDGNYNTTPSGFVYWRDN